MQIDLNLQVEGLSHSTRIPVPDSAMNNVTTDCNPIPDSCFVAQKARPYGSAHFLLSFMRAEVHETEQRLASDFFAPNHSRVAGGNLLPRTRAWGDCQAPLPHPSTN